MDRALRSAEVRLSRATLRGPSWAHPFGTDNFGRDILAPGDLGHRIDMQIAAVRDRVPRGVRHLRGRSASAISAAGRCAVPAAGEPDRHHAVPGAGDRHRGRAGARTRSTCTSRSASVGWILYGRLMRGEIMAQRAARLCGGRPRDGLRLGAHPVPPSAAERDLAGPGVLDDRHGAGDPAGIEPGLSRAWRAAAHRRMGRADRRWQELHDHGLVDVDLPGPRDRAGRDRLQPARRWGRVCWCGGDDGALC